MVKKRRKQRVTFVISLTTEGKLKLSIEFYPALEDKKGWDKLSFEEKKMHFAASDIGKYVMERMTT